MHRRLMAIAGGAVVAISLICNATAASVSAGGKGGVWTLNNLPATEGKTHHLQATLRPVTGSNTASASQAPARPDTPSDALSYAVDSKPPTIKRIFPQGNKIDPAKPYAIYEIQDNPGGSGLDSIDNIKVDISGPPGTHYSSSINNAILKGRVGARIVVSLDPEMLPQEKQSITISGAVDRLGNKAGTWKEAFSAPPLLPLSRLVSFDQRTCTYTKRVGTFAGHLSIPSRAIIEGSPQKTRLIFDFGPQIDGYPPSFRQAMLNSIRILPDPSVKAVLTSSTPDSRIYTLEPTSSAKNGEIAYVTVQMILEGIVSGQKINNFCPDSYVQEDKPYRNTFYGNAIRWPDNPAIGTVDDRYPRLGTTVSSRRYAFQIFKKVPLPKGRFEYNAKTGTLDYVVTDSQPIQFNMAQSRALLIADTGYTARANLEELDSGKFGYRFEHITEGRYKVTATVSSVTLFDIHGTTGGEVHMSGVYTVRAAAPTIRSFRYDYQKKKLLMKVDDTGTPPERLSGKLAIDGKEYNVFFDSSGDASLDLPQPSQTKTAASFTVTDLAGQGKKRSISIFGTSVYDPASPPQQTEAGQIVVYPNPQYIPLGSMRNGMRRYLKKCAPRPARNTRIMSIADRMALADLATRNSARASGGKLRPGEAVYANGKSGSLAIGGGSWAPVFFSPWFARLSSESWTGCGQTVWLDKFAPNIRNFRVDPANGTFSALIDDNGGPLDTLDIGYGLYTDRSSTTFISKRNVNQREFNPRTGVLKGTFPVDPERERLEILIGVTDSSGNNAHAAKVITTPYAPPDIKLTHTILNDSAGTVLLFAEMSDRSGIDGTLTSLSVDGTSCHATELGVYGSGKKWFCRAVLAEGDHIFTAKGSDMLGLAAQESHPFTISYKPRILGFGINSSAPATEKASVFSAFIQDRGKDVGLSGIRLSIDGTTVPASRYVFDAKSGYFSVNGPLVIASGFHRALLDVTDSHGNTDQAALSFSRSAGAVSVLDNGSGNLQFDRISLWELQNSNGDGDANPGELVRLYFSFANTGTAPLKELKAQVTINDISIKIENPVFGIPGIRPGTVETGLQGVDVHIAPDILTRENLNEKILPVDIQVTDESGNHWRFTASLVVRELRAGFINKTPQSLSAPAAPAANIQPVLVINNPVSGVVFKTGIDTMSGTFDPVDSTVASLTATLDGNPVAVQDMGGGVFNVLVFSLPDGVHTLTVTLTTSDGDSVTRTVVFTSQLIA